MTAKPTKNERTVVLDGLSLSLDLILKVSRSSVQVEISPEARKKVSDGRKIVEKIIESGRTVYGINTGFGKLSDKKIDAKNLEKLQLNLVRSHAEGVGDPFSTEEVRAIMLVRLNTLLRGHSGVRLEVIDQLADFLNSGIVPFIPRYGSLGASGDLAPSAHLALALIGEGQVLHEGQVDFAKELISSNGLHPIRLKEKEGLAIINGTQVISALASLLIIDATNFLKVLDIAGAVSLDALGGNPEAFDSRIHELRPIEGQIQVASRVRQVLSSSSLLRTGGRVQDPYSFRCIPQVHGAFNEALRFARSLVETEINSVTDNPLIFPDETALNAGNFHGQPIALGMDVMGLALAEAGAISERRIDKLVSGFSQKLPLFLTKEFGLNSGMMILQYTAAALVNRNTVLATPAGINIATVSAGQEDHASMGVTSALKAREILSNSTKIAAIELLCACQALDFVSVSKAGDGTKIVYEKVRRISKTLESDRSLSGDIEKLSDYLQTSDLVNSVFDH